MSFLDSIDPLAVPLPNGTEVSTRVDRQLGDRVVPQGAVGRVAHSDGDEVDVKIVGVGVVRYRRRELLPRKTGQLRYAARRAGEWEALHRCVVLSATVGSHAWGLAGEGSDTDVRGVFVLPFTWTVGLGDKPGDLSSEDGSTNHWEIEKAIRQGLRADPNTLELLFVDSARATDEMGQWLLDARDAFVSAEIYGTFGRYALSQLKKLEQSLRLAQHRALALEWLRDDPALTLDTLADKVAQKTDRDLFQSKQYLKQLYRSMFDQGLLQANDFGSLVAFARERSADFELPRELRPKNAYNLLRLISTAIAWLESGTPQFVVEGALRDRLLAIKRGEVALDEVLREAEALTPALDQARRATPLPPKPDLARADRLLRRIREESARRFASNVEGPFGRDASPPPPVDWESP